jgi:hypothetical protein
MTEVRNFADLPEEVQKLATRSFMSERLDNTPTEFLLAAASKLTVVVAYEQFGLVPHFFAQSYVYRKSRWVAEKRWVLAGPDVHLRDLDPSKADQLGGDSR